MQLNERYDQVTFLGEGISSRVYKAFDKVTNSWVAIKHINKHIANDPVGVERFRRELQITRQINHPQVIKIFDLNESPDGVFLIMEFLEGLELSTYLRLYGQMKPAQVIDFVKQILNVLHSCHHANVIHRDIKPQNIFVLNGETIKLLDFGISRMTSLTDLTQTGTSLGSPEYMAPELYSVSVFDPRTDLYAVGIVAYEMLAGRRPFESETIATLFRQHLTEIPNKLTHLRSDVPDWLEQIVFKLIAKKPSERYQCAKEVLFDLENQKVLSESIPALPKKKCLKCNTDTLVAVPVCLNCGFSLSTHLAKAGCGLTLWIEPGAEPVRLKSWLKESFHYEANVNTSRPTRLISELDHPTTQLFKQQAESYGVITTVDNGSIAFKLKQQLRKLAFWAVALYVTVIACFPGVFRMFNQEELLFERLTNSHASNAYRLFVIFPRLLPNLLKSIAMHWWISVPLLSVALIQYLTSNKPALLKLDQIEQGNALKQHAWFSDIFSSTQVSKSKGLREMDISMVESFLLARKETSNLIEYSTALENCLKLSFRVTAVMGDIESQMSGLREMSFLNGRMQSYAALIDLEEKYSKLNARLIALKSCLNSIVGQVVVVSHISDEQIVELKSTLQDSEQELLANNTVNLMEAA